MCLNKKFKYKLTINVIHFQLTLLHIVNDDLQGGLTTNHACDA
jgi:hypothetical protein